MEHIAAKLRNKPVLAGFLQIHVLTVFSVILISTLRNCKVFVDFLIEILCYRVGSLKCSKKTNTHSHHQKRQTHHQRSEHII